MSKIAVVIDDQDARFLFGLFNRRWEKIRFDSSTHDVSISTCALYWPAFLHPHEAVPHAAIPDSTNHFSLVNTLGESELDLACSIE